ncbi:diaminopropionate ammonia-lyase [Phytobacter ursingii]|uniref:Diaminopropionate ammonia-lyase n=1 Tax=Phytobacter ursingii TaxID=1972431 RepID=A0AAC8QUN5_9ENTR|nr:diaminopropionate ammonia-lyase [Phytobacter ursingii]
MTLLNEKMGKDVIGFHKKLPAYTVTPLHSLPHLSQRLRLGSIHIKDESQRFGLNAFKGLGGAYAVGKFLAEKLKYNIHDLTFSALNAPNVREKIGDITFVTATDGNHGRGVAWAAEQLGLKAVVYMPKGSSIVRAQNIRNHGAQCTITDLNYDDAVRLADKMAREQNWVLIQDTAWEGYERIPLWIMQGYMTLAIEAYEQLLESERTLPTHIILQAGVGSFAASVMGYFIEKMKTAAPTIIIVEPHSANCLYRSAVVGDGQPHSVGGDMATIMAGLACGEPNVASWPIIRDNTECFISADDKLAANGMRILAAPRPATDVPLISGESGAIGVGLIYELMSHDEYSELREKLALDNCAHVLLISTEGDTSPDIYDDIVWFGRNS